MRGTLALVLLVEIGNRSPELKKLVDEIFAAIEKTISETPNP
jgi:predicted amino acid-binding ACT domain protein